MEMRLLGWVVLASAVAVSNIGNAQTTESIEDFCKQQSTALIEMLQTEVDGVIGPMSGTTLSEDLPGKFGAFVEPLSRCEREYPETEGAPDFTEALNALVAMQRQLEIGIDAQKAGVLDKLAETGTGFIPDASKRIQSALSP